MKYLIRGDKVIVTKAMRDYIIEKLSKLDKYLEDSNKIEAKVLIKVENKLHKVEVTIPMKGYFIRAEESQEDMYAAIDLVSDKIGRQFKKYKSKFSTKTKKEAISSDIEDLFEMGNEEIVKNKKIFLKPMDKEEAIIQMELLSHTFFIFKNIETNEVCVLYKRKNGDYGLIETE